MTPCLLALGSNLDDRESLLRAALDAIDGLPRTRVIATSGFSWSEAVGGPPAQSDFLNCVSLVDSRLGPNELLNEMHAIEEQLGRERDEWTPRWGPRTIDIDLLLYADEVIDEPMLRVPHPRMTFRPFVMERAVRVAPTLRHPELDATLAEIERQRTRGVDGVRVAGSPAARETVAEMLRDISPRFSLDPLSSEHDCRLTLNWDPTRRAEPGAGPKLQVMAECGAALLPATPTLWLGDLNAEQQREELRGAVDCCWPGL